MPEKKIEATYIGDSVYASFDGFMIKLETNNGLPTDPSNVIYLEPEVFYALVCFAKRVGWKAYPT